MPKFSKKIFFTKDDFLILFLNFALIKYLTPHPNPLPASGERGKWKEFFILKIDIILNFKILLISFLV